MAEIWAWGVVPEATRVYTFPRQADIAPAEGAKELGIDNVFMVVNAGLPEPPFEDFTKTLDGMNKVVWSIVGDEGTKRTNEGVSDLDEVAKIARTHDNIVGGVLDDFFRPGRIEGFPVETIARYKKELSEKSGKPMELFGVLYSHEMTDAVRPYADEIDTMTFWVWDHHTLDRYESDLARARELVPRNKRLFCGVYLWGFGSGNIPMPKEVIAGQLDSVEKALNNGTADGVVFCFTPMADMDLEAVTYAKEWIRKHKG